MKKKAFVTGGSGFLGRTLIRHLNEKSFEVFALARTESSAKAVSQYGATPILGDLKNVDSWITNLKEIDVVFHCAAQLSFWGDWHSFVEANVTSLLNIALAARDVGVSSFIHVSAASVIMSAPKAIFDAKENQDTTDLGWMPYSKSKAIGERELLTLATDKFRVVVIRPPYIWGPDDSFDREISTLIKKGHFGWLGGADFPYSVAHVENVCHALFLAWEKGSSGQIYFVRDIEQTTAKEFFLSRIQQQNLPKPKLSFRYSFAFSFAGLLEITWKAFSMSGEPPLTREMVRLMGLPFTISLENAENHLGYKPIVMRSDALKKLRKLG